MWIRKGVKLLDETVGDGALVERLSDYRLSIRITLNRGDVVHSLERCLGRQGDGEIQNDGYFVHCVRIHRENFVGGIFYSVLDMRVGGYRKVEIAPHLAYGEAGVPDVIPPNAKLTAEIKVIERL